MSEQSERHIGKQRYSDRQRDTYGERQKARETGRKREMKSDTSANLLAVFSSRRREKAPAVPRTVADRWGQQEGDLEGPWCQAVPAGERESARERKRVRETGAPGETTP